MSSFNFLDDEVSEVEKANKDLAQLDRQSEDPEGPWGWAPGDGREWQGMAGNGRE
jgi:hypothetical protein